MTAPAVSPPPDPVRRVHLMGICGTAMAALAGLLQARGIAVTGSDAQAYPPMSDHLAALGIPVREGYRAGNLPGDAELVVVGNVIGRDNPEAEAMRARGLPHLSMAEAVRRFAIGERRSVMAVGTHGKTTTTALAAHVLTELGLAPGFLIGGIARNFDSNFRPAEGDWFVIEGDEYDTAYFDKTPKFFKYAPHTVLFTSLEFDHADIYDDLDTIRAHFRELLRGLPRDGLLIAHGDDPEVAALLPEARCPVIAYGQGAGNACRLEGLAVDGEGTRFETVQDGLRHAWAIPMAGAYNALNTTAVIALATRLGHPAEAVARALAGFRGVKRRQEVRGEADGVLVLDDFAHHPTAVRLTLEALRQRYAGRRLWAVFEPRSFTARSDRFQAEFGRAFGAADRVLLAPPFHPGERPLDTVALAAAIAEQGVPAKACADTDTVLRRLSVETRPGDVVCVMSNGGFDNLHERLLAALAARRPEPSSP